VLTSWHYRALVEDETNHSPGATFDYLAGVDNGSVTLYVQTDYTHPLLIDTDGNGICDEINGLMLPAGMKPWTALLLSPVNPAGGAWFPMSPAGYDASNPGAVAPSFCKPGVEGNTPPATICPSSEMIRVVPGESQGKPPAVFALAPSNNPSVGECNGGSWELAFAKPGWLCLAARVTDTIGNIGISAPLRVCFDDGSHPACLIADMPKCTSGVDDNNKSISCTISDAQKYPANMVWFQQ
jgi:hypothetical protein